MEEYSENGRLPPVTEQKYPWSCEICTIKYALDYLLKTNISEDEILSRVTAVESSGKLLADVMRDKPEIKIAKPNYTPSLPHLRYVGLGTVARSLCKGQAEVNFLDSFNMTYFLEKKCSRDDKKTIKVHVHPMPEFIHGIDRGLEDEVKYQVIKEMLEEDGVIIAGGSRKRVNGIDTGARHAFLIKGVGKDGGEQFAKVLDSNYRRQGLLPEYLIPLNKLSLDIVFYKRVDREHG
ncbi:MAG: hypothetical protein V1887_03635 [Candidatus Aenigmatarchaeota archaeon]